MNTFTQCINQLNNLMEPKTKQSNQFGLEPSNQFRNANGCMTHEHSINQLNNLMESKRKQSNQFGLEPSNQFRNAMKSEREN